MGESNVEKLATPPPLSKGEWTVIYDVITSSQVSFPANRGHHARAVLEKACRALGKPAPDE